MKRKKLLLTTPFVIAAILVSSIAFSKLVNFTTVNRAGDPVGPGITTSKNCTTCHTDFSPVTNSTSRLFTFDTGQVAYKPATTYNLKFKIIAPGPVGFSTTVLRNDSNTYAGVMAPGDTAETKLFFHLASGRYYLNHRVGATIGGMKEYSIKWTSPAKGTGPVTFYFSSLSSDNDGTSSNDSCFLNTYVIKEDTTTIIPPNGINENKVSHAVSVYPNPATERINLGFMNASGSNTIITLYSIDGKESIQLLNGRVEAGMQNLSFDIAGKVTPGIYFVKVDNASVKSVQKLLIY